MLVTILEGESGDTGFVQFAEAFIAAHSAPVALHEGILYVRVLQPALHYEPEQISKSEILRKLKQHFGCKTIRDIRFRVG
jgi:Dna[CI] antecedent, DciA